MLHQDDDTVTPDTWQRATEVRRCQHNTQQAPFGPANQPVQTTYVRTVGEGDGGASEGMDDGRRAAEADRPSCGSAGDPLWDNSFSAAFSYTDQDLAGACAINSCMRHQIQFNGANLSRGQRSEHGAQVQRCGLGRKGDSGRGRPGTCALVALQSGSRSAKMVNASAEKVG